ncbi:hypothetical protein ACWN61_08840 [Weissella paramesenteroides]
MKIESNGRPADELADEVINIVDRDYVHMYSKISKLKGLMYTGDFKRAKALVDSL